MTEFNPVDLKKLYVPASHSHKGQNGKLILIGGSSLFHAASLWALKVASRIVDMVFYSSVPENNQIVLEAKKEFRDGIIVPREKIENYIKEADCVLLGPGMVRSQHKFRNSKFEIRNLKELEQISDEGEVTYYLTKYLLGKYPTKKWVLDAGALQMLDPEWLREMPSVILTPHLKEFEMLKRKAQGAKLKTTVQNAKAADEVSAFAKEYRCVILLKGKEDVVCSPPKATPQGCVRVVGGNAGMTKGGTGDVLAGLVAALACRNDLTLSAAAGSYLNKKAGEYLFKRVGYAYNASDLVEAIPQVMKEYVYS